MAQKKLMAAFNITTLDEQELEEVPLPAANVSSDEEELEEVVITAADVEPESIVNVSSDEENLEEIPLPAADVEPKSIDSASSEEDWVKVDDAVYCKTGDTAQDKESSTGSVLVKDEVLDEESINTNDDIEELVESVNEGDLMEDEVIAKESKDTNDDVEEPVESVQEDALMEDEVLDKKKIKPTYPIRLVLGPSGKYVVMKDDDCGNEKDTAQDKKSSSGSDLVKDEVLDEESINTNDDIEEPVESVNEGDLMKDEVIDKESKDTNDDIEEPVESVNEVPKKKKINFSQPLILVLGPSGKYVVKEDDDCGNETDAAQDKESSTGSVLVKDKVLDEESINTNDDIEEPVESVNEGDLMENEVIDKESKDTNDDKEELVESANEGDLMKNEVIDKESKDTNDDKEEPVESANEDDLMKNETDSADDNEKQTGQDDDWYSADENEKQPSEQDKENKENNVPEEKTQYTLIRTPLSPAYPKEKMIVVTNITLKISWDELIETFARYGTVVHIFRMPFCFLIAFSSESEAKAATAANNKVKFGDQYVGVRLRNTNRRFREYPKSQVAFLFDLLPYTPDQDIKNHFALCGKITSIHFYRCRNGIHRVLYFEELGAGEKALQLNSTFLGKSHIRVKRRAPRAENYIEGHTIIMFNENEIAQLEEDDFLYIFASCGTIVDYDILCNTRKLAVITFKEETAVQNAMKLNGKTLGQFTMKLEPYTVAKYKRTKIAMHNVALDVTRTDIMNLFKDKVVIDKLHFKTGRPFALIEMENTDEFCNAFRLDGEFLRGQEILLKPFSDKDESLERIIYADDNWVGSWGEGSRRRRRKNCL